MGFWSWLTGTPPDPEPPRHRPSPPLAPGSWQSHGVPGTDPPPPSKAAGQAPLTLDEAERLADAFEDGIEIVGESFYQDAFVALFGPKTEAGVEIEVEGELVPERDNPHDANAVAVHIRGRKVGHLARADAALYRRRLASHGRAGQRHRVDLLVTGGWRRGGGREGHFGVELLDFVPD